MARNAQAATVSSWNGVEWYSTDRSATQTALTPYDRAPSPARIPDPPPHVAPSPSDPIASSSTATPSPKTAPDAAAESPSNVTSSYTAQAMLECHYCHHDGFLAEKPLLSHVDTIRHIPCIAVHGALDYLCPVRTAWDLHRQYPEVHACSYLRLSPACLHRSRATSRLDRIK
jgi:hypothetical protein